MFLATITMVHTAESLEALNRDTKAIQGTALENLCQIGVLKFQQIDGLNTVLPAGGETHFHQSHTDYRGIDCFYAVSGAGGAA